MLTAAAIAIATVFAAVVGRQYWNRYWANQMLIRRDDPRLPCGFNFTVYPSQHQELIRWHRWLVMFGACPRFCGRNDFDYHDVVHAQRKLLPILDAERDAELRRMTAAR